MKRLFKILGACVKAVVEIVGVCTCLVGLISLLEHHQEKKSYYPDADI
ncbi:MAG: hypothetical protein ACFNYI_01235 [Eubacterium sp.]